MQRGSPKKKVRPQQHQSRPGSEKKMKPMPVAEDITIPGSGKLRGKTALITGGDSGIGRAVALLFAKEGADIAISYLNEHTDAKDTRRMVEDEHGRSCLLIPGNIGTEKHCNTIMKKVISAYGKIDILVNNAAVQYETKDPEDIDTKKMQHTFAVNIFSFFWLTKAALPHMQKGSSIINTSSVTAYRGSGGLIDYAATKGAIVSFTRSLASNLVKRGIRVNGVAPGPVWTPLIVSAFDKKKVAEHGSDVPMGRAGEPAEIAPAYLFLASEDAAYITGQFIHPNGGEIVNG